MKEKGRESENRKNGDEKSGRQGVRWSVRGSYTVEMAGIMAVIFFTLMILLNTAFHLRAETVGEFTVHEETEQKRHAVENMDEAEISCQASGLRWSLEVTAPVFRPENSLRLWSLAENGD